jgi:hypothetical protein
MLAGVPLRRFDVEAWKIFIGALVRGKPRAASRQPATENNPVCEVLLALRRIKAVDRRS